jgi:hypothetical protein
MNKPNGFFDTLSAPVYVPPNFIPLELTPVFAQVYAILFPVATDPYIVDSLADGIMQALHAPELLPYTCYPDSRITYSTDNEQVVDLVLSPVTVTTPSNATDVIPHYKLDPANTPTDIRFAGEHMWRCARVNDFMLSVQYNRQGAAEEYRMTTGTTRSASVSLFPGYLSLYYDMPSKHLTGQFVTDVQLTVKPVFNLGACLTALQDLIKHEALFEKLFTPVAGYETVLAQLKTTFLNSPESILQFGSIVLAYSYQCAALQTRVTHV